MIVITIHYRCFELYWLKIVGASIAKLLQQREIKANIVHVHLAYEQLKAVFCNLSVILSLAWNDRMESDRSLQVKEKIKDLTKSQPNIIMVCHARLV